MPLREPVSHDTARQDREPETWPETVALRNRVPGDYAGPLGRVDLAAMAPPLSGTAPQFDDDNCRLGKEVPSEA
jgi:hypothetical protein